MRIAKVEDKDSYWHNGEKTVTLERDDGRRFAVNIPDQCWECWSEDEELWPHGLNLVFGSGDHYT
jgi:alpha-D-ribose 1-methylphosphonate 5-triphosphate synthase subunit PhnH